MKQGLLLRRLTRQCHIDEKILRLTNHSESSFLGLCKAIRREELALGILGHLPVGPITKGSVLRLLAATQRDGLRLGSSEFLHAAQIQIHIFSCGTMDRKSVPA